MSTTSTTKTFAVLALSIALLSTSFGYALTASAQAPTPATTAAPVAVTAKTEKLRAIGIREIDRRVAALNELITRTESLKRLNADARANVIASLNAQIQALTALKAKIAADADEETLKADVKSIADAYRVFALVIPQGRIVILADNVVFTADALLTLGAKLDARLQAASAAGQDVTALSAQLNELAAKSADAKNQAQAAIELIANLQPDGGDKVKMEANTKALNDARAKLKVGREDITAARAAAIKVMNALKAMKLETNTPGGTPSAVPSASGQ